MINSKAAFQNVTANSKLAMVNNRLGNPGLKRNQGSTVEVYDYVKVTTPGAGGVIRFFEGVNAKQFPLTNIQQNQLQVGEALAIEYIAITRVKAKTGTKTIVDQTSLVATVSGTALSQLSVLLDNSRILKNNSLTRTNSAFNVKGQTATNNLFFPDTDLTLPPQISFTVELNLPDNSDASEDGFDIYYGVHLFGTGAILNLKTNV